MILTPKDVSLILHARDQAHVWHLQTKAFEVHGALGGFYPAWMELADSLIETTSMAGTPPTPAAIPPIVAYSTGAPTMFLTDTLSPWLNTMYSRFKDSPGAQNIVADMQNLVDHTIYKLSLT